MGLFAFVVVAGTLFYVVRAVVRHLSSNRPGSANSREQKVKWEARQRHQDTRPPIPPAELAAFREWFEAQRRPALALVPDPSGTIGENGSRLGGPAWLADGEAWPVDAEGQPLEFLAQLDMADCAALAGYPASGLVQFFIGNDDYFGANFDDRTGTGLLAGKRLVRMVDTSEPGHLHPQVALAITDDNSFGDMTVFQNLETRSNGVALRPESFEDRIDTNILEAEARIISWYNDYNLEGFRTWLEAIEQRRVAHHTGGYPAYTQADVRADKAYADFDHTLLRLTSDDHLMWGDVGECVLLIRSEDLAKGDFGRVVYSWDCT